MKKLNQLVVILLMAVIYNSAYSHTVWVKRQSSTQQAPKIHIWTNDSGSDVAITNSANWPNNLPSMSVTGNGWYNYTINANSYGVLFKYTDKQTVDFKYYTTDKWILLDANGNMVSVTNTNPENVASSNLNITTDVAPNTNGKYPVGQTVTTTITSTVGCGGCAFSIYYTTDGTNPTTSASKIIYMNNPIAVTNSTTIKAAILSLSNSVWLPVEEKIITFEDQPKTIWVKRQSATQQAPKIHAWTNDSGTDVAITNTANWPANLPYMSVTGGGWYKYDINANSYGVLFKYSDKQSADFKYYTTSKWILLDANGNMVSVTDTMPSDIALSMSKSKEPNANGKYVFGESVTVTFSSNGGSYKRYIAYTTDGSDPKISSTYQLIVINQNTPTQLVISANTNLRAIEEGIYRSGPYSNEVSYNFAFATSYDILFNESKAPNANGKYTNGETVNVTLTNPSNLPIYYTTDGTDPSSVIGSINGTLYTVPISISENTTIKASTAGGFYVGFPVLGSPTSKSYVFESPVEPVPTFTYSTDPGFRDNGTYFAGTPVSTTFYLSYPSDNPNWEIYYSLDNNEVNLANKNTGSQNAIKYTGAFTVTTNKVVYAKLYNIVTGQSQGVSPMIFTFVNPPKTIWVKRQSATQQAPKIHVWTNNSGTDVAITNTANWPNNLPYMSVTGGGWYKYDINANSYGVLFKYADKQTVDFKYYTTSKWILLDANGNMESVTDTMPTAARETATTTDLLDQFVISPNPTVDNFTVNFSNGKTESATISIYNLSGKLLFTEAIPEGNMINKDYSANAIGLSDGVYLVAVTTATTNEIKRLVVK